METVTVKIHNQKGAVAKKEAKVSSIVFGQELKRDLVHQVMLAMRANRRISTADVKDRSEVRGGGKKPWRQKGTGRARHGSRRSPIWVGGGVTHGPTSEKDYSQKINKKMKARALFSALSEKVRNQQVIFVDSFKNESGKTKDAQTTLDALAKIEGFETINTLKKANNILVVMEDKDTALERSLNNLPHVTSEEARNLNVLDVLDYRYLIIVNPERAGEMLEKRLQVSRKLSDEAPVVA